VRHQFRITKYDPARRGIDGAYPQDDWTSYSDIGLRFAGKLLRLEDYLRVEAAYTSAVVDFLREAGVKNLRLSRLENKRQVRVPSFVNEGNELTLTQCKKFAQMALREAVWGKLVVPQVAYVHFGYDYYMYIAVPRSCPKAIQTAKSSGLFVEPHRSPYLRARPCKGATSAR
jgi:hypothetical protein